jgi:hypothetical protein
MKRPRMDVNLEELDQIIDRGTHAPLSESEGEKTETRTAYAGGNVAGSTHHRKDQERFGTAGSVRA